MKKDPTDFSVIEVWSLMHAKSIGTKKVPDFAKEEIFYFINIKEANDFAKAHANDKTEIAKKPELIKFTLLSKQNCKGSLRDYLNK